MTELLKKARRQLAGVLAHRRTVRELSTLSDRALDDIGIARCNIGYASKMARFRAMKNSD